MHPYSGSSSDAEEMLRQYSDGGDSSIRQLSSLVTVMKREYNQVIMAKHLTFLRNLDHCHFGLTAINSYFIRMIQIIS